VLAVVVDPVEQNAELAKQLGLSYRILSDADRRVIDAYDLRHDAGPSGSMARPATFVIDAQGIVRWRNLSESYRLRPRPEAVLAQVSQLG
jgi:peroxiredoxin